jgi:hypothetical protein
MQIMLPKVKEPPNKAFKNGMTEQRNDMAVAMAIIIAETVNRLVFCVAFIKAPPENNKPHENSVR